MANTSLSRRFQHPFTGMIENFFDDSPYLSRGGVGTAKATWLPPVDLSRTDEGFVVKADLPGLTREDVNLTVENNTLTLTGERSFEQSEDGPTYDRIERAYGKFSRTFHLPASVDVAGVKATFENGVLTIEIPKAEQAKSREIEIH